MPKRKQTHKSTRKPTTPAHIGGKREGAGRPRIPIDLAVVQNLAGIGATMGEIAEVIGMHEDAFYYRRREQPEIQDAIDKGRAQSKVSLRRMQWNGAKAGNATMLIWLGKQMLGQRDVVDVAVTETKALPDLSNCSAEELSTLRAAAAIMKRAQTPLTIEHDSAETADDEQAA